MTAEEIRKEIATLMAEDKLHKAVIEDILEDSQDYIGDDIECIRARCEDVSHGCQTGVVGSLIYYSDTTAFYEKYVDEIEYLFCEAMCEFGDDSPNDFFGDKWDKSDPFARDIYNRCLLAWFAYEDINRRLLDIVEQYEC